MTIRSRFARLCRLMCLGAALLASMSYGFPSSALEPGTIITRAGGGNGDGFDGRLVPIGAPAGLVVDPGGTLFISDTANHRIRKLDPSGVISTVAGTGTAGFSGDGGQATSASLNQPWGLALDSSGTLYIADSGNNRIRKVAPSGKITTVAGGGSCWNFGCINDGYAATSGVLYGPRGVAVDSAGTIYIADTYHNRIRKVSSGVISTFAGNGSYSFGGDGGKATSASIAQPHGLAFDPDGKVLIADSLNFRVRLVDENGIISTIAGGGLAPAGPANLVSVFLPSALATDQDGNVFIAEQWGDRVLKLDRRRTITQVAGRYSYSDPTFGNCSTYPPERDCQQFAAREVGDGGPGLTSRLVEPLAVAVDENNQVIVADSGQNRIRRIDGRGIIDTIAGNGTQRFFGEGVAANLAMLSASQDIAIDSAGNLFIADTANARVRKVSVDGTITTIVEERGERIFVHGVPYLDSHFRPESIAVDSIGALLVSDSVRDVIVRILPNGSAIPFAGSGKRGFSGDSGPAINAALNRPTGLTVASDGSVFFADSGNHRIRHIDIAGRITTVVGNGVDGFAGDNGVPWAARLSSPQDVTIDSQGDLYVADTGNQRIRKVDMQLQRITTFAGDGYEYSWSGEGRFTGDGGSPLYASLNLPAGILAIGSDLYISDTGNNRVRRVSSGAITTVAGSGSALFSGDGGPATSAGLNRPLGLSRDPTGDLVVADSGNSRIRSIVGIV